MKAKKVNEALGDLLKGKSDDQLYSDLKDMPPSKYLLAAATLGYLPGVKDAMRKGANVWDMGHQAITMAAKNGKWSVVKYMLNNGKEINGEKTNVNARNNSLIWAAWGHKNFKMIDYLVSKGANVSDGLYMSAYKEPYEPYFKRLQAIMSKYNLET